MKKSNPKKKKEKKTPLKKKPTKNKVNETSQNQRNSHKWKWENKKEIKNERAHLYCSIQKNPLKSFYLVTKQTVK